LSLFVGGSHYIKISTDYHWKTRNFPGNKLLNSVVYSAKDANRLIESVGCTEDLSGEGCLQRKGEPPWHSSQLIANKFEKSYKKHFPSPLDSLY
jgi:hypothetical protein